MSLGSWKRRVKLGPLRLNLSASQDGVDASPSIVAGPLTVNPKRRRWSLRLPFGLTKRGRW